MTVPAGDEGRGEGGSRKGRGRRPGAGSTVVMLGVGLALIVGAVVGLLLSSASSAPERGRASPDPATGGTLSRLEQRVSDRPADAAAWAALGAEYVNHARVNSDPSAYPKAERALDRSLELRPEGNWQALAAHGALAAGRHDFARAYEFAERARAFQPRNGLILSILVDSLTELGRYDEAIDATQTMVDLRPDLASYARVSYQRELHGDVDGAIEAMELALRSASTAGDQAFAQYYLGELEWHRGEVDAAARHYELAIRTDPTAMQAVAGLGKVAAARGNLDAAIARYEEAVAGFPDPETVKVLGELQLAAGDREAAEASFTLFHESNATQAAGGVNVDLEIALFSADHRRNLDEGLDAARREWQRRQSIHVADALAWQLFAHGRHGEALPYADRALALGTPSASFHFHRAEIHRARGNRQAALADYEAALALNPHFSFLHRDRAAAAVDELKR